MSLFVQPQAIPYVQRRQAPGIYRVAQAQVGATSFATKRVLGLWVPADAFRRATVIRFTGQSSTASPVFRLSVGGNAASINAGVALTFTTGPAAAVGFDLRATQRTDSGVATLFDSSGFFAGATSLVVSTGTFSPNIQPLNYVEVNTSGTFSLSGCILEVIIPQWNARPREEMFDV